MLTKEEIIKELQKYAKELGNKTPSEKNVYENTSIGIMDRRKYWANYGELVQEAGLTPNTFDKTKYTDKQLFKFLIEVIREKKKWPTRGILEVKHHNNPSFPDYSTFTRKFGLTNAIAQAVLNHVKDRKGFEDIIGICNSIIEKSEENDESISVNGIGYVYLLKSTLRNATAYKIGRTKDIESRKAQLRQPSNVDELLHYIETDDPIGVEKYWHNRFEQKRLYPQKPKDEWFKLTPSDVKVFKRWQRII